MAGHLEEGECDMWITTILLLVTACVQTDTPKETPQFEKPVRIESNGIPIDVTVGHAAPYMHDFDGDGITDLLVGEYGDVDFPVERLPKRIRDESDSKGAFSQGRLRIYKNHGSDTQPKFNGFEYLRAGAGFASIPST